MFKNYCGKNIRNGDLVVVVVAALVKEVKVCQSDRGWKEDQTIIQQFYEKFKYLKAI